MSDSTAKKFKIQCTACEATMFSSVDPSGKRVKCPKCGERFVAQVMSEPPAPKSKPPVPEPENPFAGIAEKAGVKPPIDDENPFAGIADQQQASAPSEANPFAAPSTSGSLARGFDSRHAEDARDTITINYIHPLQAGKNFAVFFGLMTVISLLFYVPIVLMIAVLAPDAGAAAAGIGVILFGYVILTLIVVVVGFVYGALGAFVYNKIIVRIAGGFRVDYH